MPNPVAPGHVAAIIWAPTYCPLQMWSLTWAASTWYLKQMPQSPVILNMMRSALKHQLHRQISQGLLEETLTLLYTACPHKMFFEPWCKPP